MTEEIIIENAFHLCQRLEQENKELKKKKDSYYQQTLDDEIQINNLLEEIEQIKQDRNVENITRLSLENIRLEQENKELKNIIKIHDSTKYDYYKLMKENEEWHIKYAGCNTANKAIQEENKKYRSALEEIKSIADEFHYWNNNLTDASNVINSIKDKINEVI